MGSASVWQIPASLRGQDYMVRVGLWDAGGKNSLGEEERVALLTPPRSAGAEADPTCGVLPRDGRSWSPQGASLLFSCVLR